MHAEDPSVYDGLTVCLACGELRGAPHATPALVEECACDRKRAEDAGLPYPDKWKGYDYNSQFELCRCCAVAVLACGSRWSGFFCDACHSRVVSFNQSRQGSPIPVGRHSIMNGTSLAHGDREDDDAIARFVKSLAVMFRATDRVAAWTPVAVRRNLDQLQTQPGGEVDLREYAVAASCLIDKEAVFEAFSEYWTAAL